jgi:hypothetical protein
MGKNEYAAKLVNRLIRRASSSDCTFVLIAREYACYFLLLRTPATTLRMNTSISSPIITIYMR